MHGSEVEQLPVAAYTITTVKNCYCYDDFKQIVEHEIKKELEDEKKMAEACDTLKSDDENDEEEYEAWKIRELRRMKRDREEREA